MSLTSELEALATKETNLSSQSSSGKVANFSYTDDAYQADQYEGHSDFVAGRGNNIPLATSTSLKTNQTVLNTGYREQGASIVRHLANHFFGRVSYNLNKAHDNLLAFISLIKNSLGGTDGIATLRSDEARLTASQAPYAGDIPATKQTTSKWYNKSVFNAIDILDSFITYLDAYKKVYVHHITAKVNNEGVASLHIDVYSTSSQSWESYSENDFLEELKDFAGGLQKPIIVSGAGEAVSAIDAPVIYLDIQIGLTQYGDFFAILDYVSTAGGTIFKQPTTLSSLRVYSDVVTEIQGSVLT